MNALDENEVHRLMESYGETDVTDGLYAFGSVLIAANRERRTALEGKAMTVAGYALAILAFLISKEPSNSVFWRWPPTWVSVASLLAGLALGCAGAALFIQRYAWFSDSQWFEHEKDVLEDVDSLKRCHVMAMHAINRRMNQSNDCKANFVLTGQALILGGGICLAIWVLFR